MHLHGTVTIYYTNELLSGYGHKLERNVSEKRTTTAAATVGVPEAAPLTEQLDRAARLLSMCSIPAEPHASSGFMSPLATVFKKNCSCDRVQPYV